MKKLNIHLLQHELVHQPAYTPPDTSHINPYLRQLFERVEKAPIPWRDIDFSAFSLQDLAVHEEFTDVAEAKRQNISDMAIRFQNAPPIPMGTRLFC